MTRSPEVHVTKIPVNTEQSHQSYKTKLSDSSSNLGSVLSASSSSLGLNIESLSDLFGDDEDSFQVFMASICDSFNEESQRKRSDWVTSPSPNHANMKNLFSLIEDHTESEGYGEDLDQSFAIFMAALSDIRSKEQIMTHVQRQARNNEARRLDSLRHRIALFTNPNSSSDGFPIKEMSSSNHEMTSRDLPPKSPRRGETEQREEQQLGKISSSSSNEDASYNRKSSRSPRPHSVCGTTNKSVDRWSPVKTSSIQGNDFHGKNEMTPSEKGPRSSRRHSVVASTSPPSQHSVHSPGGKSSKSLRPPRRHSIVTGASPCQSPFSSPGGKKSRKLVFSPVIRTPRKTIRDTTSPMRRLRQVPCHEGLSALPFDDDDIEKRKYACNKCSSPSASSHQGRQNDMTPRRPLRNRSMSPLK